MHVVGFIIRLYRDARSSEFQIQGCKMKWRFSGQWNFRFLCSISDNVFQPLHGVVTTNKIYIESCGALGSDVRRFWQCEGGRYYETYWQQFAAFLSNFRPRSVTSFYCIEHWWLVPPLNIKRLACSRLRSKCDGTRAETRYRLSAKRTSPFKSAESSVQSTIGSRVVRMSGSRLRLKCDGTRAETRFRLSSKRTSPFKSTVASVQSTTGSRGVRISGSNAGYTMFRGSVKGTGFPFPLHFPSLASPCAITFQLDSTSTILGNPLPQLFLLKTKVWTFGVWEEMWVFI